MRIATAMMVMVMVLIAAGCSSTEKLGQECLAISAGDPRSAVAARLSQAGGRPWIDATGAEVWSLEEWFSSRAADCVVRFDASGHVGSVALRKRNDLL